MKLICILTHRIESRIIKWLNKIYHNHFTISRKGLEKKTRNGWLHSPQQQKQTQLIRVSFASREKIKEGNKH